MTRSSRTSRRNFRTNLLSNSCSSESLLFHAFELTVTDVTVADAFPVSQQKGRTALSESCIKGTPVLYLQHPEACHAYTSGLTTFVSDYLTYDHKLRKLPCVVVHDVDFDNYKGPVECSLHFQQDSCLEALWAKIRSLHAAGR